MTVLVRRIRSAIMPAALDESVSRLLVYALFWVSTAVLAAILLIADPVFGSFVVGIPLLLMVLVRERGLDGIPPVMFGAVIGSSLVFSIFLGQDRGIFDDGVLVTGFVTFLVWLGTYPIMVRQMDRQYLRERTSSAGRDTEPAGDAERERPGAVLRLYVVRAWMPLLAAAVVATVLARDLIGV